MDNHAAGQRDDSTPPQAETDLPLGSARIPANRSLQLVLFLATCVSVQHASSHLDTFTHPPLGSSMRARAGAGGTAVWFPHFGAQISNLIKLTNFDPTNPALSLAAPNSTQTLPCQAHPILTALGMHT